MLKPKPSGLLFHPDCNLLAACTWRLSKGRPAPGTLLTGSLGRGDGRFKIADALIRLAQPDRVGGLRVPQSFQMSHVESRSERDLVGINPPADGALRFLRSLKDFLPSLILPLEPGLDEVHLLFVFGAAVARRAAPA
jgi:hypothetical protein